MGRRSEAGCSEGHAPAGGRKAGATADKAADEALARIQTLVAASKLGDALDVYEAFAGKAKREDVRLLLPIARGHLESLSGARETEIRVGALNALARSGDPRAKTALVDLASTDAGRGAGFEATVALAGLRDAGAVKELRTLAATGAKAIRPRATEALGAIDPSSAGALALEGLRDPDPMARMGFINLAARFAPAAAVASLQQLLQDRNAPFLRLPAAAALRRTGNGSGDEILRNALASPLNDARLIAARALSDSGDRSWVEAVRPVLQDPDGLNRLVAAELLLPVDRPKALEVLKSAAADANPVVRAEAARILAAMTPVDVPTLRAMLRDTSDSVRLRGAAALFQAGTASAKPPAARTAA